VRSRFSLLSSGARRPGLNKAIETERPLQQRFLRGAACNDDNQRETDGRSLSYFAFAVLARQVRALQRKSHREFAKRFVPIRVESRASNLVHDGRFRLRNRGLNSRTLRGRSRATEMLDRANDDAR